MIFQNVVFAEITHAIYRGFMAIVFMVAGFRLLSGLIATDINHELQEKNVAVGMAVMGMFIGIGVGVGLALH